MSHTELEDRLSADMREVICQLFQDHVDLRASTKSAWTASSAPRALPTAPSRTAMSGLWPPSLAR
jgi:hypothetical protein